MLADFTAHPEKYLKRNAKEGVEEKKASDPDNYKNRKISVWLCDFDSEQCEHIVSV